MNNEPDNLRKNIRFLMIQNGFGENATRLAEAVGLNQPTLHRIMKGESSDPKISNIRKIAAHFGISVGDLLDADLAGMDKHCPVSSTLTLVDMAKRALRLRDALHVARNALQVIHGNDIDEGEVAKVAAALFEISMQSDKDISDLSQDAITSAVLSALSG